MKGDLHTHSYYSDGYVSPAEVVKRAACAGCEIVSLTDHDTTDGTGEALAAARELGLGYVVGVEISTLSEVETHVLGYGVDIASERFVSFIEGQKLKRRFRAEKIFAILAERGITFPEGAFDFKVKREISRSHIANALVKYGYEKDFDTAFHKWLRSSCETYVPIEDVPPEAAIEEIHAAGGYAVLAHPVRLDLDPYDRTKYIERLAAAGLDGIEAVYKRSTKVTVSKLRALAERLGLFVTAGADFHHPANEIIPRELDCAPILELAQKASH